MRLGKKNGSRSPTSVRSGVDGGYVHNNVLPQTNSHKGHMTVPSAHRGPVPSITEGINLACPFPEYYCGNYTVRRYCVRKEYENPPPVPRDLSLRIRRHAAVDSIVHGAAKRKFPEEAKEEAVSGPRPKRELGA